MNITFILPFAGIHGGIKVVAQHARELVRMGHQVTVLSTPHTPPTIRWRKRIKLALRLEQLPAPHPPATWFNEYGIDHRQLPSFGPPEPHTVPDADVIIATWWETAEWVAALPPEKGRKFYLLQDYEMFEYLQLDRVAATFHLPLTKIAVSNYIRDSVQANHAPTGHITVVPNAVDVANFTQPVRVRTGPLTVGVLYTPASRKNVARALKALEQAKVHLPTLRAFAFGAKAPTDTLPLPDWMLYHQSPDQVEIPKLYAAADVWLFPSDNEGFGLPILEAMACRTPVLGTHAGAGPEIIDGRNGRLLPHSVEAFAQAIIDYAALSPEDWCTASDAAFATAQRYTWGVTSTKLFDCLKADACHRS